MKALSPVLVGSLLALAAAAIPACEESSAPPSTVDAGTPDGFAPDTGTTAGDASASLLEPCPAPPTGAGTEHAKEITADETWTAAASPHRVTFGIRLLAKVTIEPCATVLVGDGYTITVGTSGKAGSLVAKGQRGVDASGAPVRRAVTFAAADPAKPWGSISIDSGSKVDLESTILTDGAAAVSDQNGGGVILAYGIASNGPDIVKNVRAVDVTIERSRGYGMNFQRLSAFTDDSKDIVIKGSGRADAAFPLRLGPGALSSLPGGLSLTGNNADEVEILSDNTSMVSDTIKARGVPYRVSGRLRVAPGVDGAASVLTIEAGVTLRFDSAADDGLQLGTSDQRQGVLVAAGTAAAPITFTSAKATPAAADWKNIYFSYSPPTGNRIENAVIEYAGKASGAQSYGCGPAENDASILILSGRPTDAFIKNTTFRNGGGDTGLILGWTSDQTGPDFVATNTFTNMPACHIGRWRNVTGEACPGSVAGSPVCF
jgi:hypothetical protein